MLTPKITYKAVVSQRSYVTEPVMRQAYPYPLFIYVVPVRKSVPEPTLGGSWGVSIEYNPIGVIGLGLAVWEVLPGEDAETRTIVGSTTTELYKLLQQAIVFRDAIRRFRRRRFAFTGRGVPNALKTGTYYLSDAVLDGAYPVDTTHPTDNAVKRSNRLFDVQLFFSATPGGAEVDLPGFDVSLTNPVVDYDRPDTDIQIGSLVSGDEVINVGPTSGVGGMATIDGSFVVEESKVFPKQDVIEHQTTRRQISPDDILAAGRTYLFPNSYVSFRSTDPGYEEVSGLFTTDLDLNPEDADGNWTIDGSVYRLHEFFKESPKKYGVVLRREIA